MNIDRFAQRAPRWAGTMMDCPFETYDLPKPPGDLNGGDRKISNWYPHASVRRVVYMLENYRGGGHYTAWSWIEFPTAGIESPRDDWRRSPRRRRRGGGWGRREERGSLPRAMRLNGRPRVVANSVPPLRRENPFEILHTCDTNIRTRTHIIRDTTLTKRCFLVRASRSGVPFNGRGTDWFFGKRASPRRIFAISADKCRRGSWWGSIRAAVIPRSNKEENSRNWNVKFPPNSSRNAPFDVPRLLFWKDSHKEPEHRSSLNQLLSKHLSECNLHWVHLYFNLRLSDWNKNSWIKISAEIEIYW